jgi:hypothetical protein
MWQSTDVAPNRGARCRRQLTCWRMLSVEAGSLTTIRAVRARGHVEASARACLQVRRVENVRRYRASPDGECHAAFQRHGRASARLWRGHVSSLLMARRLRPAARIAACDSTDDEGPALRGPGGIAVFSNACELVAPGSQEGNRFSLTLAKREEQDMVPAVLSLRVQDRTLGEMSLRCATRRDSSAADCTLCSTAQGSSVSWIRR